MTIRLGNQVFKAIALFFLGFFVFLGACNGIEKANIHDDIVDGKKFTVYSCTRKTYVSNYLFYQFQLDKTQPVEINALDSENGLPYRTDVFNGAPVTYLDTVVSYCEIQNPEELVEKNSAYLYEPQNNYSASEKVSIKKFIRDEVYANLKTERQRFLIFLDPKKYTTSEFALISNAISKNLNEIDSLLFACQPFTGLRPAYDGWQLSGLVYGELDDFCETYTKNKEDYFKVFPDGRIAHYNQLAVAGKNWFSGQDFIYGKVVMPRKTILLRKSTKNDLMAYKNQSGKSLVDNFNIEQGAKDTLSK
jgi:hypothetical protein